MKYVLLLLACFVSLQAKDLKCQEMLNVEIVFDQKNVPEKFLFSFDDKVSNSGADVLFPIQKAVDYEGIVQFKSEYAILTYHISYENPDEKKIIDSADVVPVKSLNGVKGSGRSIGFKIAVRSVSNNCNHESFSSAENSPL